MTPQQAEYQQYLRSWRWWALRTLRKWLDGGRCRLCGTGQRLEVHHRDYRWRGRSWLGELLDLTTVCRTCHADYHDGD